MDTNTQGLYLTVTLALAFITLLLLLFIGMVIRNLRYRMRELRNQVRHEVELIDRERNRISIDLHDELGAGMAAVCMLMRMRNEHYRDPTLTKAIDHLNRQYGMLRDIAQDLSPRMLETHGLDAVLTDLLEEMRAVGKLRIVQKGSLCDTGFSSAQKVHIYRIVKEITTNVYRHAAATEVVIHIVQKKQMLKLQISDNGKGFDPDNASLTGSGLSNIKTRITALSGNLALITAPGRGSCYTITLPIS
ncbi:MAG: ATP-binding protein [Bacteroidota bacterium]